MNKVFTGFALKIRRLLTESRNTATTVSTKSLTKAVVLNKFTYIIVGIYFSIGIVCILLAGYGATAEVGDYHRLHPNGYAEILLNGQYANLIIKWRQT